MDIDELRELRTRLGLDDCEVVQAQDPAGYARRWRIRTGRVASLTLPIAEVEALICAAEELAALKDLSARAQRIRSGA